jgi:hypothetical protein
MARKTNLVDALGPMSPRPTKSHGQIFYECSGTRQTKWETLSLVSRQTYDLFASHYDAAVK